MNSITSILVFTTINVNPGGTLKTFDNYKKQIKLLFTLFFKKSDGTAYSPTDAEKKAMTLLKSGKDMHTLFDYVGNGLDGDTFDQVINKIRDKLTECTNKVVQQNMLLTNFLHGAESFKKWSLQVSEAAKLINYNNYDWKQAAVDAIILQTSSSKLKKMSPTTIILRQVSPKSNWRKIWHSMNKHQANQATALNKRCVNSGLKMKNSEASKTRVTPTK